MSGRKASILLFLSLLFARPSFAHARLLECFRFLSGHTESPGLSQPPIDELIQLGKKMRAQRDKGLEPRVHFTELDLYVAWAIQSLTRLHPETVGGTIRKSRKQPSLEIYSDLYRRVHANLLSLMSSREASLKDFLILGDQINHLDYLIRKALESDTELRDIAFVRLQKSLIEKEFASFTIARAYESSLSTDTILLPYLGFIPTPDMNRLYPYQIDFISFVDKMDSYDGIPLGTPMNVSNHDAQHSLTMQEARQTQNYRFQPPSLAIRTELDESFQRAVARAASEELASMLHIYWAEVFHERPNRFSPAELYTDMRPDQEGREPEDLTDTSLMTRLENGIYSNEFSSLVPRWQSVMLFEIMPRSRARLEKLRAEAKQIIWRDVVAPFGERTELFKEQTRRLPSAQFGK